MAPTLRSPGCAELAKASSQPGKRSRLKKLIFVKHASRTACFKSVNAVEPLDLVHNDICRKMNARSLGGAEYFLAFIDDNTHYTWIYVLKHEDEVFACFKKWKALVEKASSKKLKVLCTDNGGNTRLQASKNSSSVKDVAHHSQNTMELQSE